MKTQDEQEKLMELIKSNLRVLIHGSSTDSYSKYVAELTLRKILESEKAK